MRVLCLDIEGGNGGSSKSLFELVRHIDHKVIDVEVICRRPSHLLGRYAEINIPCSVWSTMPVENSVVRTSRNFVKYARGFSALARNRKAINALARKISEDFDLVHFNHEGLFLLARVLREKVSCPFVMHGRTAIADNFFGRWQCRVISRVIDEMVFITENEQRTFPYPITAGRSFPNTVIYNAVGEEHNGRLPLPELSSDRRFKVAHLNNYSLAHGGDRIIEIAAAIKRLGRQDLQFIIAGHAVLEQNIMAKLGLIRRGVTDLRRYAAELGVEDMVTFIGHVAHTDRVLASCDVLVHPSRLSHPWGRTIIEALAAGLPVIATGSYERFVIPGVTGLLHENFDIDEFAIDILALADDPARTHHMGKAGANLAASLCNGVERAFELRLVWQYAAAAAIAREKVTHATRHFDDTAPA